MILLPNLIDFLLLIILLANVFYLIKEIVVLCLDSDMRGFTIHLYSCCKLSLSRVILSSFFAT